MCKLTNNGRRRWWVSIIPILLFLPLGEEWELIFCKRETFFLEFLLSSLSMLCVLGTALPQHTAAALLSRVWNNAERFQGRRVLKDEQRKDFYFDSKVVHFFLCFSRFLISIDFSCPRRRSSIIRQAELSSLRKISNDEISELDFHSFFEHLRFAAVAQN